MKVHINMTCLIGKEEIHKIFNNFSKNYPEYASYMSGMYHKANDGYDTFEWSGELPETSFTDDLIRLTHHAEGIYDVTGAEYVHVEVCIDGKWYGKNSVPVKTNEICSKEKIFEPKMYQGADELFLKAEAYQTAVEICQKTGIKNVVDFNCGLGYQSEEFALSGIYYLGIGYSIDHFFNMGMNNIDYYNLKEYQYPHKSMPYRKTMAICCQYTDFKEFKKHLSEDFDVILVYDDDNNIEKELPNGFMIAGIFKNPDSAIDHWTLIVRERLDKTVLKNVLNPKYSITGVQFPGEDGITSDGIDYILSINSGYYFDFRRIDGQNSSAIFAFDSDIYAEMEANGEFDDFDRLVVEVLNDTNKEKPKGIYDCHGTEFYLVYAPVPARRSNRGR